MRTLLIGLIAIASLSANVLAAGKAKLSLLPGKVNDAGFPSEIVARYTIDFGWHMYWTNPGDSGMAPQFKWTLPEGVKAGTPKMPVPHRIDVGDGLTSYGYENELVIFIPLEYEKSPAGEIDLKASVVSLVCADVCLRDEQSASIKLSTASKPEARLEKWRALLPTTSSELKSGIQLNADKATGYVFAHVSAEMKNPEVFPPNADFVVYLTPERVSTKDGDEIRVPFRVLPGVKTQKNDNAEAILAYTNSDGRRVGISFTPAFGL